MINLKAILPCAFVSDHTLVNLCLRHIKSLSILNSSVQQKLRWTKFNTKSLGIILRPWRWTLNFYYSKCSLSLRRAAHGSKHMFLELIHGLFIT
jgi:hypothetical protein